MKRIAFMVMLVAAAVARAGDVYVAPSGNDSDSGSIDKPFATIQRAQGAVGAGDTVFVRGGRYVMREEQVAKRERIWAYVTVLDRSGEEGRPIRYVAVEGERPVFDLSGVKPEGLRVTVFRVTGSWIEIKGIEVTGVQVTIQGHTQSICFENAGSHNVYERLSMHDGMGIGFYGIDGSDNLILNCDAWNNYDSVSEGGRGGNVDGFGWHGKKGSKGNVFRGCRAWFNSDDGYDCINAHEVVRFENCWAMYNGYSPGFERRADGNGFKAGGYGSTPADRLPNPVPRHVVRNSLAVRNKANGFYANHHPGGVEFVSNTASGNGADYNMLGRLADNRTDVDGVGHVLRNNVAFPIRAGRPAVVRMNAAKCESKGNAWDFELPLSEKDFLGTDEGELIGPRQAGGELPAVRFLHPAAGGVLAGHPELGAFTPGRPAEK